MAAKGEEVEEVDDDEEEDLTPEAAAYRHKHRNVRRNWELPAGFPSRAVTDAYLKPSVDNSEMPCQWSRPDLYALRTFCEAKFGWTSARADQWRLNEPWSQHWNRQRVTVQPVHGYQPCPVLECQYSTSTAPVQASTAPRVLVQ